MIFCGESKKLWATGTREIVSAMAAAHTPEYEPIMSRRCAVIHPGLRVTKGQVNAFHVLALISLASVIAGLWPVRR